MRKSDVVLYKEICKCSLTMEHNSLYYALLDWKDQHPEVGKEAKRVYDSYTVKHLTGDGVGNEKRFTADYYENPYQAAFLHFSNICNEPGSITELWKDANPTMSVSERKGKLLKYKEMERK